MMKLIKQIKKERISFGSDSEGTVYPGGGNEVLLAITKVIET